MWLLKCFIWYSARQKRVIAKLGQQQQNSCLVKLFVVAHLVEAHACMASLAEAYRRMPL